MTMAAQPLNKHFFINVDLARFMCITATVDGFYSKLFRLSIYRSVFERLIPEPENRIRGIVATRLPPRQVRYRTASDEHAN
jgi:hypothetical protein